MSGAVLAGIGVVPAGSGAVPAESGAVLAGIGAVPAKTGGGLAVSGGVPAETGVVLAGDGGPASRHRAAHAKGGGSSYGPSEWALDDSSRVDFWTFQRIDFGAEAVVLAVATDASTELIRPDSLRQRFSARQGADLARAFSAGASRSSGFTMECVLLTRHRGVDRDEPRDARCTCLNRGSPANCALSNDSQRERFSAAIEL